VEPELFIEMGVIFFFFFNPVLFVLVGAIGYCPNKVFFQLSKGNFACIYVIFVILAFIWFLSGYTVTGGTGLYFGEVARKFVSKDFDYEHLLTL
jgi:hypothetical protein